MLMKLRQILESSDVEVLDVDRQVARHKGAGTRIVLDAVVRIRIDDRKEKLLVETRQRAPYRGEIANLPLWSGRKAIDGVPILVAPFISESVGKALVKAGWGWADQSGNCDIRSKGLRIVRRTSNKPERTTKRALPGGSGGLTMVRWLVSEGKRPVGATELAKIAGVSQPRASQCLADLERLGLVQRIHRSGWLPDGPGLWKAFLDGYRGPKGTEEYYYSLDSPLKTAVTAARAVSKKDRLALSSDVGPDCLVPSRSPTQLVIYYAGGAERLGTLWQEAKGRDDSNVIVRSPQDTSIFGFDFSVTVWDTKLPLAHPTQMAWDLYDLGGEDRMEQADELEEWTHNFGAHQK